MATVVNAMNAKQLKLVQDKTAVLQKAREVQVELAKIRAELARFDVDMLKAGFEKIHIACW